MRRAGCGKEGVGRLLYKDGRTVPSLTGRKVEVFFPKEVEVKIAKAEYSRPKPLLL